MKKILKILHFNKKKYIFFIQITIIKLLIILLKFLINEDLLGRRVLQKKGTTTTKNVDNFDYLFKLNSLDRTSILHYKSNSL